MNREKILLFAVAAVALFVGYDIFIAGKANKPETATQSVLEQDKMLQQILETVQANVVTSIESHIIEHAKEKWTNDPFPAGSFFTEGLTSVEEMVQRQMEQVGIEETVEQEIITETMVGQEELTFIFSGYMEMGTASVAVIDGKEYVKGDKIGKFVLGKISQDKVVLKSVTGGYDRTIPFDFKEEM